MRGIALPHNQEIRVSQYADDLIVFLDDQSESINGVINEIKTFTSMSGLKLNVTKTKCLPIGVNHNNPSVNTHGIEYVKNMEILGITFNQNNNDITTLNIVDKLPHIEKEIIQWKRRHLTLMGKITVIKSLLLSKLVHIFIALPNPTKNIISRVETMFFNFIWNDKKDRIKRTKLIQQKCCDGLNMTDLLGFIQSMKITWIERLYNSSHAWLSIAEIPSLGDIRLYGQSKLSSIKHNIHNPFWRDVLDAWIKFCTLYKPNSDQIITEPLWFTNVSKFKNSIIKSWYRKGIRLVADLINNETGTFYSKQEIESIYNVKMTFLCYTSLIRSLPSIVKTTNYKLKRYHPILPYKVGLIHGKTKLSRVAYREFQTALIPKYSQTQAKLEQKWIRDIGCFHLGSMSDVCSVTKNTYIQTFHFRIINRIIATKRYLHIVGRSDNNRCTFCSNSVETIFHLFWDCEHTKKYIADIKRNLSDKFSINYNVTKETWFFPNLKNSTQMEIMVATLGKMTIYKAQYNARQLSSRYFHNTLKLEIEKELNSAKRNNTMEAFSTKWGTLKSIAN